ncbi:IclR family transcriptional regulator [Bifidobacterium simiarum]|nr:IclR family transcriptional regulator [Bifidobacterium simiarum]
MAVETYQTIAKAAKVLEALGNADVDSMRAADVERVVNFGASTTVRLLTSLEAYGLVTRTDDQQYALGAEILRLSSQKLNHDPLFRESRVLCEALAQETGLNAYVIKEENGAPVYICNFEGRLSPKNRTLIGLAVSMHASAMGKCLMMDMTEEERRAKLGDELVPFNSKTVRTHEELTRQIEEGRRCGYCIEDQEVSFGRLCIAAPIRDASEKICASISVAGRLSTMRKIGVDELAEQVLEAADRISVNLGMIGGNH